MGSCPSSAGRVPLVPCRVSWLSLGPPSLGLSPPRLTGRQVQQRAVRPLPPLGDATSLLRSGAPGTQGPGAAASSQPPGV